GRSAARGRRARAGRPRWGEAGLGPGGRTPADPKIHVRIGCLARHDAFGAADGHEPAVSGRATTAAVVRQRGGKARTTGAVSMGPRSIAHRHVVEIEALNDFGLAVRDLPGEVRIADVDAPI